MNATTRPQVLKPATLATTTCVQEQGLDTVDANRALGLPDDCREYTSVANILRDLRVRSVQLMVRRHGGSVCRVWVGGWVGRWVCYFCTLALSHGHMAPCDRALCCTRGPSLRHHPSPSDYLQTNNPRKLTLLQQLGIAISGRIPCQVQAGELNAVSTAHCATGCLRMRAAAHDW